jgi:hypothetical protein
VHDVQSLVMEVAVEPEQIEPEVMTQTAPYPSVLAELVTECTYRPDWLLALEDGERDPGCGGLTLIVVVTAPDSYDHQRMVRVRHLFPVPPATYNRASWCRWLFETLLLVERHEAMEFFTVGGVKPYAPNHGPGHDPYVVRELASDVDRRTNFRGEVQ